jgi:hypothetical protein
MSKETMMNKAKANQIANGIVDLVEEAGGPVTFARIEQEILGFAAQHGHKTSWDFFFVGEDKEDLIWDDMTEEGYAALQMVITERKVAIQVTPQPIYWLEGRWPHRQNWLSISLLPARMANLQGPRLLARGDKQYLDQVMARAAAEGASGYRVIGPPA